MPKEIWLSPVLSGDREDLVSRCAEFVRHGKTSKFLYLTASRPLLDRVTAELVASDPRGCVWGSLPVFLFRGLVREIVQGAVESKTGTPLGLRIAIDDDEFPLKRSLVSSILRSLADSGELKAIGALAGHQGCVTSVAKLLGEIQRAGVTPEDYARISAQRAEDSDAAIPSIESPEPPARRHIDFDQDISRIYHEYSEALVRHQLTENDAEQLRAIDILGGLHEGIEVEVPWLSELDLLVIDGFYDFTPAQGAILRKLIPRVQDVVVHLNSDPGNPEIFEPFNETVEMLQATANFEIRPMAAPVAVAPVLAELRTRLFNSRALNSSDAGTAMLGDKRLPVRIANCSDRSTEIRFIAKEIKRLVLVEGFRPSEIAVVLRECSSYADLIARVLDDEGVPCRQPRTVRASEIPAARAALKWLQLLNDIADSDPGSIRTGELLNVIKTGYFALSPAGTRQADTDDVAETVEASTEESVTGLDFDLQLDQLEAVIRFVGCELPISEWLRRAEKLARQSSDAEALLRETLDETEVDGETNRRPRHSRVRSCEPLSITQASKCIQAWTSTLKDMSRLGSPKELSLELEAALDRLGYSLRIQEPLDVAEASNEYRSVALDLRARESLLASLHSARRSLEISADLRGNDEDDKQLSLRDFVAEVRSCLESITLELDGADQYGVAVLAATDVRGLRFRAVFIAGLVEGFFPMRAGRDWIYPPEERERLKKYGLTLEDTSPSTLLKEEHYFYQAACRATERLYLTRPLVSDDGGETVASYYIDELRHALRPIEIGIEEIRAGYEGANLFDCSSPSELVLGLMRLREAVLMGQQTAFSEEELDSIAQWCLEQNYQTENALSRVSISRNRAGTEFGRHDGVITAQPLLNLVKARFGPGHVFSASQLAVYGKCPFKFFAECLLGLEATPESATELSAVDSGLLWHEILRRFFENYRSARLNRDQSDRLKTELHSLAEEVYASHRDKVPSVDGNTWRLEVEICKMALDRFLADEIELQEKTAAMNVLPSRFELGFGMPVQKADSSSIPDFLRLERPSADGTDGDFLHVRGQIDRVDVADDGTVVAYDYKLRAGGTSKDMKAGRDLQLGIYLEALEQLFFPGQPIAGGGYYSLKGTGNRRNQGLYRKELSAYTGIGKAMSNMADDEWLQLRRIMLGRIWAFWDGMRAGRFPVSPSAPQQTCKHCDVSSICRYEQHRIRSKQSAMRTDQVQ